MSLPSPSSLETINTPCLVLDRPRLVRNLDRFARIVAGRGVRLRPHLKTAKSIDVARLAAPDPTAPIAVSTLLEAEYFAQHGYRDILYPVGFGPGKFDRAAALLRAGVQLMLAVEHPDTAQQLVDAAKTAGVRVRALIEIDSGDRRGGIDPANADLIATARALGESFAGVMTHGGHSYDARSAAARDAIGHQEADAVRQAAATLAGHGFKSEIVSVGSSPTAITGNDLVGVTELRAGVYMFGDLFQAGIETCAIDDIAISVLTEVIGRQRGPNHFLIDAGAFALSKDLATASLPPPQQAGYGLVCDVDGRVLPGLRVERVWQEHGLVVSAQPLAANAFPVGTRLRILPNHACPTAAAHAAYHVVEGTRDVSAIWPRVNGW
jgi:D-serine deaminase-like pyridoxal phosphate-dependent protein